MASYGVAVMECAVWAVKRGAFFLVCLFFIRSEGAFEGTLPQFHMHAAQAYEIAGFFLLFSRSIAFKNALSQLIVLK